MTVNTNAVVPLFPSFMLTSPIEMVGGVGGVGLEGVVPFASTVCENSDVSPYGAVDTFVAVDDMYLLLPTTALNVPENTALPLASVRTAIAPIHCLPSPKPVGSTLSLA